VLALASTVAAVLPAALSSADSFTPVRLTVSIAPVARLDRPLRVTVAVSADAGVLDFRTAPLRARVKLAAGECAGTFATTAGPTLLDAELSPQPETGHVYSGSASGAGTPGAFGRQTVCVFLEEEGDSRQFAYDASMVVDVSQPCTAAADRFEAARHALSSAQRRLRRTHRAATRQRLRRLVARRRTAVTSDRSAALAACGSGVPL
jgi:hypothetical protein